MIKKLICFILFKRLTCQNRLKFDKRLKAPKIVTWLPKQKFKTYWLSLLYDISSATTCQVMLYYQKGLYFYLVFVKLC